MTHSTAYAKAFKRNCRNVRMTENEEEELARLFSECQKEAQGHVVEAERRECEKLALTYEQWCENWGELKNEIAAREMSLEIAAAIKARGEG